MSGEILHSAGAEPPKRRLGCLFYAIASLLVIGIGLSVMYRVWYSRANRALVGEMARIKARGEPLWFSGLAPSPLDPADDATTLLLAALQEYKKPPQPLHSLLWPNPPAPPMRPGKYEVLESALVENERTLDLIRQAVQRPRFRLPIDYRTKQPLVVSLEPLQKAREISWLLAADVLQSIGTGDNNRAVAAVQDGLRLAELFRDEPFVMAHLLQIGIAAQAIMSLQSLAEHTELTPEQFAALDDQLALMESRFRLGPAVRSERAMLLTAMSTLGNDTKGIVQWSDETGFQVPPGIRLVHASGLRALRLRDQAFMLRFITELAETIDESGAAGDAAWRQLEAQARPSPDHALTSLLSRVVMHARYAGIEHRQRLATARLGIRVRRFHIEHGKFPASLDAITDEKLPTVPLDPACGKPLVFRGSPDGFVIYPVGYNGVDDGGGVKPDSREYTTRFEVRLPSAAAAQTP